MSSFLVSEKDVKNFVNVPRLYGQKGIYFTYSAPPEVINKLIPPPLQATAPVIVGYIVQFTGTTFGGPYMESLLATPCTYNGESGAYAYNLMLYGHGAEGGTIVGSNCCGIPKKTASFMEVNRVGDRVTAKIERHGVTLLDCEIELGKYNTAVASSYLGDPAPGSINPGVNFFHTFNMIQTENGNTEFSDVNLVKLITESKCKTWEPGNLTIRTRSSEDDPFGELAVLQPMGAAFFENEYIEMSKTVKLESLDANIVMPYLMTGRYDRSMMGYPSAYLTGYNHK
ncbi:acetoacetate decarboxylase family protein [Peptostreptococcus faecalis]|uniref:acetoacetate decarboxylase family protein n=1 Tax=Peptostreptococcus faecalis TaxID=2045015 RepID=UPI000C79E3D2|nr:acetoacetate decarboxylase family protein [Peptostreptococcus faecalis]